MRRTITAACAAALLGTLAACGGRSQPDAKPPASASPTSPKPATTKSTAAELSPTALRTFGKSYTNTSHDDEGTPYIATVSVLGYEQDVAKHSTSADEEFNTDGYVWAALELKVCAKTDGISASRFPWVLAYTDGARVEPSGVTYGDFPKPEYPIEAQVKKGDCIRGKIVFPVPGNQRPHKVVYSPDSQPESAEWSVPAK
ncbi:hypothetical protein [Streptomyces sp. NPDC127084]|uniref:hypothetical protein n=1 Tax=Streptomyces sp. NPDC127084 TaxID=3347133 RepID=UPI0036696185